MQFTLEKSLAWYQKCKEIIQSGSSTLAKSPEKLIAGKSPFYVANAYGSHFTDIDGNDWLDCEMAMGSVVWGHAHPAITSAITEHLNLGVSFSLPGIWELKAAEKLLQRYKGYEAVKFFKNGADCVWAAIRSSRYITRKTGILFCEYHGWLDWCAYSYYKMRPEDMGISPAISHDIFFCEQNTKMIIQMITQYSGQISCAVLCPTSYIPEELDIIIRLCKQSGVHVIFDEVSTGIRYSRSGYSGYHNLSPDFLCISKGLTNGYPLAAVMGKQECILVMSDLKISNAHSGENTAFWAELACEVLLDTSPDYPSWRSFSIELMEEINQLLVSGKRRDTLRLRGYHGSFYITSQASDFYQDPFRKHFIERLSSHRIFTKGYVLLSEAHTPDELEKIRCAVIEAVETF